MMRAAHAVLFGTVYAITVGSASVLDWAIGAAIGLALPAALPAALDRRAVLHLPRLVAVVAAHVLAGAGGMLRVLLGVWPWRHVGEVDVPYAGRSRRALEVLGYVISASPGTAAAAFDDERGVLVVNTIDARDAAAVRAGADRLLAEYQRGRSAARRA